jgi:hypothetical protein
VTGRSIFLPVREIDDPAQRSAYLDRACAGDPALRAQVEQPLKAHRTPAPSWRVSFNRPVRYCRQASPSPARHRPGAGSARRVMP